MQRCGGESGAGYPGEVDECAGGWGDGDAGEAGGEEGSG